MKYNIITDQVKALEFELTLSQSMLMTVIFDLNTWSKETKIKGKSYFFLARQKVKEILPLIYRKDDTVYKDFKALAKKGLIEYIKDGKRDMVRIADKAKGWLNHNSVDQYTIEDTTKRDRYNSSDKKQTSSVSKEVQEVVDYFNQLTNRSIKAKTYSKSIEARLKTFSVQQLKDAILAMSKDSWYVANNQVQIKNAIKSDEKVDFLLAKLVKQNNSTVNNSNIVNNSSNRPNNSFNNQSSVNTSSKDYNPVTTRNINAQWEEVRCPIESAWYNENGLYITHLTDEFDVSASVDQVTAELILADENGMPRRTGIIREDLLKLANGE